METRHHVRIAAGLIALCCVLLFAAPARGQIVTVTRVYRVVAVDPDHQRIKVANVKGEDAGSVLVMPDTKVYVLNHEVPNFSWHLFQKGMQITVKGGMTWGLQIKAHAIYIM